MGYLVAEAGSHIVSKSELEQIASHSLAATVAIPIGSYAIAPEYWRSWRKEQPIYSSGIFGVMAGASIRALQEILS
ncbi:MAG TPA: hypothetical protein VJH37_04200 [Candidatus Nanoarchaeia archaeon]|nr:hypothetical protein [Candidatus Nanoarchaeia archaeon]